VRVVDLRDAGAASEVRVVDLRDAGAVAEVRVVDLRDAGAAAEVRVVDLRDARASSVVRVVDLPDAAASSEVRVVAGLCDRGMGWLVRVACGGAGDRLASAVGQISAAVFGVASAVVRSASGIRAVIAVRFAESSAHWFSRGSLNESASAN